jgi:hypothetical protein
MVEVLDIPLDKDVPRDVPKSEDIMVKYKIDDEDTIRIANPNEHEFNDQERGLNSTFNQALAHSRRSSSSSDFFNIDYSNENEFYETKEILK